MTENEHENTGANPSYVVGQFVKALLSKGETATKRVTQWQQVLHGMLQGTLEIGSRVPVVGTPPWVTLEVVNGGFVTGNSVAGGNLQGYECEKVLELQKRGFTINTDNGRSKVRTCRTALNVYYAGEDGRQEFSELIRSGCFRVHVPEEAALLISTWLLERGETQRASQLLEVLSPYFDRLRFYPRPAVQPLRTMSGDMVYLRSAGFCVQKLRGKHQQQSVVKMNESLAIWAPLCDRAVSLFLETVEGKAPELVRNEVSGELARTANGQPIVEGGWPCKFFPADWSSRASGLLQDYDQLRKLHGLCKKYEKPKENFARLRKYLAIASKNSAQLSGKDVGSIRRILASIVTARGAPGSERLMNLRSIQREVANRPLHTVLASVLADRLSNEPDDEGVPELERFLGPLDTAEAIAKGAIAGTVLPPAVIRKALGCGEASIASFIRRQLISSSESMALVLPMLTARVKLERISDPNLARLYSSVYQAFRKRRSLLLFNLERQVRFEELPWISAIRPLVSSDEDSQAAARSVLDEASNLAISAFPHTIIPNKLVKELRTLSKDAALSLHLVDELAADIFMGAFSANFLYAAQEAARLLQSSIYERYYGIDYQCILALDDIEEKWHTHVSPGFAQICAEMAAYDLSLKKASRVASNGALIERAQILTTHNLASLWRALDMGNSSGPELPRLARSCFQWICWRLQITFSDWKAEIKSIKNCAYAWRQMIFYVSLFNEDDQKQFLSWADGHFNKQSNEFKQRFAPAIAGLTGIMSGEVFDSTGRLQSGGRRFTGWSKERHFLRRQSESRP